MIWFGLQTAWGSGSEAAWRVGRGFWPLRRETPVLCSHSRGSGWSPGCLSNWEPVSFSHMKNNHICPKSCSASAGKKNASAFLFLNSLKKAVTGFECKIRPKSDFLLQPFPKPWWIWFLAFSNGKFSSQKLLRLAYEKRKYPLFLRPAIRKFHLEMEKISDWEKR